eukprot:3315376-Rhodomonas_salina.1
MYRHGGNSTRFRPCQCVGIPTELKAKSLMPGAVTSYFASSKLEAVQVHGCSLLRHRVALKDRPGYHGRNSCNE